MKREADEGSCQGKGSSEKNENEWRSCLRPLAGWRNISWSDDSKAQGETMQQSTSDIAGLNQGQGCCAQGNGVLLTLLMQNDGKSGQEDINVRQSSPLIQIAVRSVGSGFHLAGIDPDVLCAEDEQVITDFIASYIDFFTNLNTKNVAT